MPDVQLAHGDQIKSGAEIKGGPDQCTRSCMDTCNSFELDEAASNLDAFWNMSAAERDGIIAQTTEELTQVIGLRDGPVQEFMDNEGELHATLRQWQSEFEEGIDDDAIDNATHR